MGVWIDPQLCRGCGLCQDVCPGGLIDRAEGLARIKNPELCWGCAGCLKACPHQAATLFLDPALGGAGVALTAQREGNLLIWRARRGDWGARLVTDPDRVTDY
ncbi:MAG: ferredoxin family protein [Deltaproteobacteria bacterium]|jgi:adenylylsulfate reductase subunit B|nr:ferredoxin family protein [Deltaproteobacteria bacterium]